MSEELVVHAEAVASKAYAPYSKYNVGAVVQTVDGREFEGVNVENAAFPLGVCAEKSALAAAVAAGYGPGSSWGMRVSFGADARVWRGLFVGLQGNVERFALTFDPRPEVAYRTPPCPCVTTGGAVDLYYGAGVHAGWRY